jgi:flagellar basal-body rod protein FlgB
MFDKLIGSLQLPAEALKLRAKRQEVITANISNADTPNYKAVDFRFADALGAAAAAAPSAKTATTATNSTDGLVRTHGKHFEVGTQNLSISPFLKYRQVINGALDNNSVDMDRERAAFAENTVKYEAALRVLNGRVSTLKQAMGSGNQ